MKLYSAILAAAAVALIPSCASIGTPSGGPRDEDPPRFLHSTPGQGATEFSGNKVVLTFDEYVNVKDAFSNVVVSPPSANTPRVSSQGKRITVEFRDTLLENTTYTVDFGDAIVDNNEGNKLENFLYTFSTGPQLDTLMISGMVLGSLDLEPQKGMYVGLHSNLADSAFRTSRFDRIAKTNEKGQFAIGGLAPGSYRVYALTDLDGDLKYSSPEESIAFYDVAVSPYSESITVTDTIWDLKTGMVDTVVGRVRTRFLPNNILLRSFNSGYKQQYITKYERPDSARILLEFNAANDLLPDLSIITGGKSYPVNEAAVIERSATNDTLTLWLNNPLISASDTLRLAVGYFRADSAYNPMAVNDTLRLLKPKIKAPDKRELEKERKKLAESGDSVPPLPTISFKMVSARVEKNSPLVFEAETPLDYLDSSAFRLEMKVDTIWTSLPPPKLIPDSLNPRRFSITEDWQYGTDYRLTADSLAARSIHGLATASFKQDFKIRPESEYSSLQFNIRGIPDSTATFVELLDGGGKVVRREITNGSKVIFEHLLAAKYVPRIIFDSNGNGLYDPGNFDLGIQPDVSYYYPEPIELKQNWSQELDWNIFAVPVDKMKEDKNAKREPRRD